MFKEAPRHSYIASSVIIAGLSRNLMHLLSVCEWNSNYLCELIYLLSVCEFHVCFRITISVSYELVIMYVIWKCVQWKHDSCDPLIKIIWAHLKFLTCGTRVWYYDIWDKCKTVENKMAKNKRSYAVNGCI